MIRNYDDWKLATPDHYERDEPSCALCGEYRAINPETSLCGECEEAVFPAPCCGTGCKECRP